MTIDEQIQEREQKSAVIGKAPATSTLLERSAPTEADLISQQFAATSAQINSVDTSLWQRFLSWVSGK